MKKQQSVITKLIDEKYIPLEPKFKVILGIALLLVPIILFYFLFFQPKTDTFNRLNKNETELVTKVRKDKKRANNLNKAREDFEKTEAKFLETADMLPKDKEIPELLKNISALGQNAGLDFLVFSPGKDIPKDFYAEIPLTINVNGPYHNMGYFLDQVSKLNRIVSVSNIKMASPKKVAGEMLLSSSCTLVTYRFTNKPLEKDTKKKKKK